MFQKLRLKLTLINVTIMFALFFLLICGTYFFAKIDITRHTKSLSQRIAADIQADLISDLPPRPNDLSKDPGHLPPGPSPGQPPGTPPLIPPGHPAGFSFFFVKTSPDGAITFQSSNQPLNSNRLTVLTERALKAAASQDTVILEEATYYYFKAPLNNQPGIVIVFHDLTPEISILHYVLTTLIAVGIICALLSFVASLYMANRAMVPIKKAWQQQHDFLSDASHELRTPLTIIQTNLDIVNESLDETVASQRKWLDNIQEESICMKNLVNSLLFLARADSSQQASKRHHFCLNTAISEAAAPFEAVALQKNLLLEIHSGSALECYGDESQLKQVIAILLDNANRHTTPGGKISIALTQSAHKILLTVTDSGEGIEPEHLDKIFDRFYQVDKSRNKGGSGLGLAIAKCIIDSHGGSITVTSTPGTGTTFTIQLPRKSAS